MNSVGGARELTENRIDRPLLHCSGVSGEQLALLAHSRVEKLRIKNAPHQHCLLSDRQPQYWQLDFFLQTHVALLAPSDKHQCRVNPSQAVRQSLHVNR